MQQYFEAVQSQVARGKIRRLPADQRAPAAGWGGGDGNHRQSSGETKIVSDGAQALEFIRNQRDTRVDARPWVVLLDLHLPKHDGIEILRTIQDEPALNHIDVIVLTGGASRREEEEIRRWGAHWRPKPIQLSGFAELAAEVIAICKRLRSGGDSARKSSIDSHNGLRSVRHGQ